MAFVDRTSYSSYSSKKALIINDIGYKEIATTTTFGSKTDIVMACFVKWKNKVYLYGGYREKRQISVVEGVSLKRIGGLFFDFYAGSCTATSVEIVLCFPSFTSKECYTTKDVQNFSKMTSSLYHHVYGKIAAINGL